MNAHDNIQPATNGIPPSDTDTLICYVDAVILYVSYEKVPFFGNDPTKLGKKPPKRKQYSLRSR